MFSCLCSCCCHNVSLPQAVPTQSSMVTCTGWQRSCLPGRWRGSCLDFSGQVHWLILTCSDIFPRAWFLSQEGLVQPGLPAIAAHFPRASFGVHLESSALASSPSQSSLWGPFVFFSAIVDGATSVYQREFSFSMICY